MTKVCPSGLIATIPNPNIPEWLERVRSNFPVRKFQILIDLSESSLPLSERALVARVCPSGLMAKISPESLDRTLCKNIVLGRLIKLLKVLDGQ